MPVIDAHGQEREDFWRVKREDEGPSREDFVVYPTSSLQSVFDLVGDTAELNVGVWINVDENVEAISSFLPRLGLVELIFPHFKDGRPFSTAADLRRRFGFAGDLRASGDILPDQALFLIRCGFSSVTVPEQFTVQQFNAALSSYSVAYQSGLDDTLPLVVGLRRPSEKAGL